jgi:hypothetical protein
MMEIAIAVYNLRNLSRFIRMIADGEIIVPNREQERENEDYAGRPPS